MELLPLLYALLAAITGVSAGNGPQLVARAPIAAETRAAVAIDAISAASADRRATARPLVMVPRRFSQADVLPRIAPQARVIIFAIAGFANRRE